MPDTYIALIKLLATDAPPTDFLLFLVPMRLAKLIVPLLQCDDACGAEAKNVWKKLRHETNSL